MENDHYQKPVTQTQQESAALHFAKAAGAGAVATIAMSAQFASQRSKNAGPLERLQVDATTIPMASIAIALAVHEFQAGVEQIKQNKKS